MNNHILVHSLCFKLLHLLNITLYSILWATEIADFQNACGLFAVYSANSIGQINNAHSIREISLKVQSTLVIQSMFKSTLLLTYTHLRNS